MSLHKALGSAVRLGSRGLASALLTKSERDWLARTAADLRKEAKARGLSQIGTKAEITRRLIDAERQAVRVPSGRSVAASSSSVQQSTPRAFTSSAKWNRELETPTSQFTPRRPYLLNVIIPEPPAPIEESPTIPYLPDFFQSQSAGPIPEPPEETPRVLTVASAATHGGGGPSHGLYGTATDAHLHEVHGDKAAAITSTSVETSGYREPGIVDDILEEVGLFGVKFRGFPVSPSAEIAMGEAAETSSTGAAVVKDVVQDVRSAVRHAIKQPSSNVVSEEKASAQPTSDKLKPEEVQGVYALAGIISVGYLLSKIFA